MNPIDDGLAIGIVVYLERKTSVVLSPMIFPMVWRAECIDLTIIAYFLTRLATVKTTKIHCINDTLCTTIY